MFQCRSDVWKQFVIGKYQFYSAVAQGEVLFDWFAARFERVRKDFPDGIEIIVEKHSALDCNIRLGQCASGFCAIHYYRSLIWD